MSVIYWIGSTTATQQEDRFTPANVEVNDIFTLTATAEDGTTTVAISFTATAATVANVTAGLTAAWNASTNSLCTPVTATDVTTYVKLVADTAGRPFSVASTTTDGGGANTQTLTRAATTANVGGGDWNTAANWSTGAVPANSDTIIFNERATTSVTYGLNHGSLTPAAIYYDSAFSFEVGDANNSLKTAGTPVITIGRVTGPTAGNGSTRIRHNVGTGGVTINILRTAANSSDTNKPPFQITGGTGIVLNVSGGNVGIAVAIGETATVASLNIETGTNGGTPNVYAGQGATLTAVTQNGGSLYNSSAQTMPAVNVYGGSYFYMTDGTGAHTALNVYASGTAFYNGSGTATNETTYGILDLSNDPRDKTFTNPPTLYAGATFRPNNFSRSVTIAATVKTLSTT